MIVENIATYPWNGAGSIGLRTKGRDSTALRNMQLSADIPIYIAKNPNNIISIDHFHFEDTYLIAAGNPCVFIEDGVNLTNVNFDGYQAWVAGTYGLYWHDTTTTTISEGLRICNLRTEQGTSPTAYSIYISHNTNLQSFVLEDAYLELGRRGVYSRKVERSTFIEVIYGGVAGAEALNFDGTGGDVELSIIDCFFQVGSTVSMTAMVQKFALHKVQTGSPIPETCYWASDGSLGNINVLPVTVFSGKMWSWNGTLANGAFVTIPATFAGGRKITTAFIAAHVTAAPGPFTEGGYVLDSPDLAVLVVGTARVALGNNPNQFNYLWQGGASVVINNLGADADVDVVVFWN